jgi:hypothetical protein
MSRLAHRLCLMVLVALVAAVPVLQTSAQDGTPAADEPVS